MTRKFFLIRGEKRRHSSSYVEYFQRRRRGNFRLGLDYFICVFGIRRHSMATVQHWADSAKNRLLLLPSLLIILTELNEK
jgi:hypothetical protein